MTNLALIAANKLHVVESFVQATLPAAEAITAGMEVRIDAAGKFTTGNGSTAPEADVYGIAAKTVPAGMALTAVRKGVLEGYELGALAYWAKVYLSDTDGMLADAAGTVSVVAGHVIPGWAQLIGSAADKLLAVDFTN